MAASYAALAPEIKIKVLEQLLHLNSDALFGEWFNDGRDTLRLFKASATLRGFIGLKA